jgi:uncharacterized membrane protein (UPF0182 family)
MNLRRNTLVIFGLIIAAVVLLRFFITYYGDWLWFENVGFAGVFTTTLWAKVLAFAGFFVIFAVLAGLNIAIARKWGRPTRVIKVASPEQPLTPLAIIFHPSYANSVWALIIFLFSIMLGSTGSDSWMAILQFLHRSSFGVADPIFHKDVGFYVFALPLYLFLRGWYLTTLFLVFVGVTLSYYIDQAIGVHENRLYVYPRVKSHLAFLGGLFLLGIAWTYRLKLYGLMYSTSGVAYGAGYADVHAQIPAYWALFILALAIAVLLFLMPILKRWRWLLYVGGVYLVTLIGLSWIYPTLVEQYIVKPNELVKETPYIKNNIDLTRLAFGLDKAKEQPFPIKESLTYADIQKNEPTIHNIRLWDHRPLIATYKQLQEIRLYYDFKSVNVDRYQVGNKYTEVAIAARELPPSLLPGPARTWVNTHLVYTHGYGAVMSPVNEVTPDGLPELIVKDIPPRSTGVTTITRPEVYYGEETEGFCVVHTETKEFDYPKGNENVYASYEGRGGVQISSFFRRLVYAADFFDVNLLFSRYITSRSRIMFHRIITDRDYTIAPFLAYDSDPYIVVGEDGHLYWIHDAYTTSDMFPYSQPLAAGASRNRLSYIRNSVKVVIDAYNGDVSYYLIDPSDPVARTYGKIFPTLFKPINEMPSFLKTHIRYPIDLFTVQAQMYATYHMTDPQVFYNREDLWNIPQEIYKETQQTLPPYYIIMRLPGTSSEEFILMLPLTPSGKDNMVAWMCARCDGDSYGQLVIYMLSKEKLIYGPMQIEARINQKPDISAELTLWGQRGSSVIRGNLLIIPIEHSFIYVEPIYLQSEQGQMPQLKRVIAVQGGQLEMRNDLDEALRAVFSVEAVPQEQVQKALAGVPTGPLSTMAQEALNHYNKALNYLKQGNWAKYGDELSHLRQILETMAAKK